MDIQYRTFRNTDPPALVRIWNESLTGRGAAFLQGSTPLEYHVLSKSYFDPRGLIVAWSGEEPVGFAHAGFGPDARGEQLAHEEGVIAFVVVRPSYRRQGVATQLLHRAEEYLRSRGAQAIFFGGLKPLNPFYLGIYGGAELPGILASDAAAEPFLLKNNYKVYDRASVMHRGLEKPVTVADARFPLLRRNYEIAITPRPIGPRWYDASLLAQIEMLQFKLVDKSNGQVAAEATVWDMDLFGWRWHQPAAGVFDFKVEERVRRQGLGKFLLVQILQYLQDQFFTLAEIQAMESNAAARQLCLGLEFKTVDEGRIYRLAQPNPPPVYHPFGT